MIIVDVFVPGAAKTKGSMVARPNGSMKESVVGSSQWRALMAQAVRDDIARRRGDGASRPWHTACSVTVVAYLTQPSTPRFLDSLWYWPIWERAGDLDKLVRNVLDALGSRSKNPKMNGGAIVDDNLVCHIDTWKRIDTGDQPGIRIKVETL